jgi:cobalt-zinc-cadmium efflux system outer membrane protein
VVLLLSGNAVAATPHFALSLSSAETAALAYSPRLKAAAEQIAASRDRADSQRALLIPRLTLDGSYKYVTEVPEMRGTAYGAHRNTSIGPTLTWTLWDQGALYKGWRSQLSLVQSQKDAEALARNQILLGSRLAYFQVQLALEQVRLIGDFMNLAESQYQDIRKRLSAGSASRVDALSAHQEVLSRRKDFRQAQADLASALHELLTLTGNTTSYDLSRVVDGRVASSLPAYTGSPTLLLELDPLSPCPVELAAAAKRDFDAVHPQLRMYSDQAEANRLSAKSLSAGRWPKILLSGRSSYDYPNGPVLETVQQNAVSLSASVPLFEASKTQRETDEQNRRAAAAEATRQQSFDELRRDWFKARDQYGALRDQEALDRESVSETGEISRLKYLMYKEGGLTFLEVENANLKALQSKVTAALTQAQMLIRLATLDSLSAHR